MSQKTKLEVKLTMVPVPDAEGRLDIALHTLAEMIVKIKMSGGRARQRARALHTKERIK